MVESYEIRQAVRISAGQQKESEEMDKERIPFMQRRYETWQGVLVTVLVMAALICFVFFLQVPNPNMILIAGLVICSAVFGYSGGIPAALIMIAYTLFFFSDNYSFVHFSDENWRKVMVSFFGILVDMFFVCALKRREDLSFREIRRLSEKLRDENEKLQEASLVDALTGIGNRLALRKDFNSYLDRDLFAAMLDVDNFKLINDRYGHLQGDQILEATGRLISGEFGREHCYRYGGDEFLIIASGMEKDEFLARIGRIMDDQPRIDEDPEGSGAGYSIGWCSGRASTAFELRGMLDIADENMYQAKTRGKNRVVGDADA